MEKFPWHCYLPRWHNLVLRGIATREMLFPKNPVSHKDIWVQIPASAYVPGALCPFSLGQTHKNHGFWESQKSPDFCDLL